MERTFLGSGILPALTDTVPAGNSGAFRILYRIILRQVPTLDDIAKVLNIGVAGSITTILDETVCLLVLRNPVTHINIDVDVEEMVQDKRGLATYEQIKDYVLEHSGLKVSSLYIAQVKQKYGIIERENYNKPKSEDARQPQCPLEKERAITEALKHFGML